MSRNLTPVLSWIVTLLVPLALILGSVWAVLHPWFVNFEYHTPGFPPDSFGFTIQDRLRYSRLALNYLMNDAGISYLADIHFPAGQKAPELSCIYTTDCTQFFNERELSHMVDVKRVVQITLRVWYISVAFLLLLGVWAWQGGWLKEYWRGLSRGGLLTPILVAIILIFVVLDFDVFFVLFHEIFFRAGTWTFLYSDSLIRLFPERFWRDTFLVVGILPVILGILVWLVFRRLQIRQKTLVRI